MMIYFKNIYLLTAIIIASSFLLPNLVSASTYPQGTLVKSETGTSIYYIASNGKKFPFPDALTYKTWYSDFKNITKVSDDELKKITNGNRFVTVRPGTKLVKFAGSKGVYVVLQGAVLKKISNVEDARELNGSDWYKEVIVLPSNLISSYSVGGKLEDPEDYSAIGQRNAITSINDSLIARGIVAKPGKIYIDNSVNLSRLKLLQENFSDSFSPRFSSFTNAYSLSARYDERILGLKPMAYSDGTVIKIDGLVVKSGVEQGVRLQEGTNIIKIEVADPDREPVIYTVVVYRASANASSQLSEMKENLASHNFEPSFNPNNYNYDLKADYGESFFKIKFSTYSKYTKIYVNGKEYGTSSSGYNFNLEYGDNEFRIFVVAQDGSSHTYNLTVYRSPYKNLKEASLSSLKTNLKNGLTPVFDMNEMNYEVRARAGEKTAQFKVVPVNSNAIVAIDDVQRTYVSYAIGFRTVKIHVVSPDGLERTYKVKVYPVAE